MDSYLSWLDHVVIAVYVAGMIALGAWLGRRQRTNEEYFLAGRRMPWFAVGISVIASLLSSLTYLSEPGEVWRSGLTHMSGKMLAIPLEMVFVWLFCIPFLMRFRFTSAYEYVEGRFGYATRLWCVLLFLCLVISWMGFVVLASSRALAEVSGVPLWMVIVTVGVVATIYTTLGGLRAVIWTDVVQVALLVAGAGFAIVYVAVITKSGLAQWYASVNAYVASAPSGAGVTTIPLVSIDPRVRASVVTVALHMFTWHICTHLSNQMTVQRYYSTRDLRSARRSFVTAALVGVMLNLLLVVVGMAILHYYQAYVRELPAAVALGDTGKVDLIFPAFVVQQLPAGAAGAILAALLAAAMSSIDSGVNSVATVTSIEWRRIGRGGRRETESGDRHGVRRAQGLTIVAGALTTLAAFGLDSLASEERNIVDMMPRSFNCFIGALGGVFLVGLFMRRSSGRSALPASICGLATAIFLAYFRELLSVFSIHTDWDVSFTWVMPCSLLVTVMTAFLLSRLEPRTNKGLPGYSWRRDGDG